MTEKNIYNKTELNIFRRLNSPKKIQDYLNTLKINFEKGGDTDMSPRFVIKTKMAHCMEGAMLAAAALEFHGHRPLLMDLRSESHDYDHVVTVFKRYGRFGCISKTNHAVLRYREPVYRSLRELAMSFFHEYFDDEGRKTLREYSKLLDLNHFNNIAWRTTDRNLLVIADYLDEIKHFKILNPPQIKDLRKADKLEIAAGKLTDYKAS